MEKMVGHGTLSLGLRLITYLTVFLVVVAILESILPPLLDNIIYETTLSDSTQPRSLPITPINTNALNKSLTSTRRNNDSRTAVSGVTELPPLATELPLKEDLNTYIKKTDNTILKVKSEALQATLHTTNLIDKLNHSISRYNGVNKVTAVTPTSSRPSVTSHTTTPSGDCLPLRFGKNLTPIAVAGFPGSGNTWTGHLIQQITGIYVGSAYCAEYMTRKGFKGECRHDDTVVVVRTHRMCHSDCCYDGTINVNFSRAVLLVRDPYDALMSEFNRVESGRTGHATSEEWEKDFPAFFQQRAYNWIYHLKNWLEHFRGPLLILRYEDLLRDLGGELQRLARFLGYHTTRDRVSCVVNNAVGMVKRKHKKTARKIDPFTPLMKRTLDGYIKEADEAIGRYWKYRGQYIKRENCKWK